MNMFGNTSSVNSEPIVVGLDSDEIMSRLASSMASREVIGDNPFVIKKRKKNPCFITTFTDDRVIEIDVTPKKSPLETLKEKVVDLIEVHPKDKTRFVTALDQFRSKIRDFLLFEIAPFDMALAMSMDEVSQELAIITSSPVQQNFETVSELLSSAVNMKVVSFLANELSLDPQYVRLLIEESVGKKDKKKTKNVMDTLLMLAQKRASIQHEES